jgi:hypothetical protein
MKRLETSIQRGLYFHTREWKESTVFAEISENVIDSYFVRRVFPSCLCSIRDECAKSYGNVGSGAVWSPSRRLMEVAK